MMMQPANVDWINDRELIGFFGGNPVQQDEFTQVFVAQSEHVTLHFEICQADRFASIELFEKESKENFLALPLPNYAWLKLHRASADPVLTIGPPKSSNDLVGGGGAIVCPVIIRLKPALCVTIDRENDRLRLSK